jgi:hypothetical protein
MWKLEKERKVCGRYDRIKLRLRYWMTGACLGKLGDYAGSIQPTH